MKLKRCVWGKKITLRWGKSCTLKYPLIDFYFVNKLIKMRNRHEPVTPEPNPFKLCSYVSFELLPSPLSSHGISYIKLTFRFGMSQFLPVILA